MGGFTYYPPPHPCIYKYTFLYIKTRAHLLGGGAGGVGCPHEAGAHMAGAHIAGAHMAGAHMAGVSVHPAWGRGGQHHTFSDLQCYSYRGIANNAIRTRVSQTQSL